jgi:hypothetical protein
LALTHHSKCEKQRKMIAFPIKPEEISQYCFLPPRLPALHRGLFEDYQQLRKICPALPYRYASDFASSHILLRDRVPLTPVTASLLNYAAAALRQRASLAERLHTALVHSAPQSTVYSLAVALLHALDQTNFALAHLCRVA